MRKQIVFVFLMFAVLLTAISALAEENLIWSNFNNDPVMNNPKYYGTFPVPEDHAPVMITRIRTFHWNNGNGAEPGMICALDGDTTKEIQCWQAVGRSAYGVPNVYWEALTDFIMYPGQSYGFKDSDFDSWSNNEASGYYGMIELYGEDPAPVMYNSNVLPEANVSAADISVVNLPAANSGASAIPTTVSVGQTFTFGRYEQDNNAGNGKEPIEWQVLTVQNGRALVISKYALDFKAYNDTIADITWENSSLRTWLNGDFYTNSFTDAEKAKILTVTNENPDNPLFGTEGGNQTQDRIFVLSSDEAQRYFKSDTDRICAVTKYAAENYNAANSAVTPYFNRKEGTSMKAFWWLRTPGDIQKKTVYVTGEGSIYLYGNAAMVLINGTAYDDVRPAFWLKTAAAPVPTATPTPRNCYKVKYVGSYCLNRVPTDNKCYQPGEMVTVLWEPVDYMPGLIFNGWDMGHDGVADFGYSYPSFIMPAHDVELQAVCYQQYWDNNQHNDNNQRHDNNQYYDITPGQSNPVPNYYPDYYPDYDPNYNNPYPDYGTNDPGSGWWFDYGSYYDGVG